VSPNDFGGGSVEKNRGDDDRGVGGAGEVAGTIGGCLDFCRVLFFLLFRCCSVFVI
jgi:hypothetical protein